MQWSQLKNRIESTFAVSIKGRIEIWSTRYRRAVHQYGESWITFDKQKIATMGTLRFEGARYDTARLNGFPWVEAVQAVHDQGIFDSRDLNSALFSYLSLSIDDAIESNNPIIQAFAILDRRFGKRRLADFDVQGAHPLVQSFYMVRCQAEGFDLTRRMGFNPPTQVGTPQDAG